LPDCRHQHLGLYPREIPTAGKRISEIRNSQEMATFLNRFHREKSEKILPTAAAAVGENGKAADAEAVQQQQQQQPRPQRRYMRSATAASVTQLLSESCNSLLQRFRRNPSERPDNKQQQQQQQHQQQQQQQHQQQQHQQQQQQQQRNR